MVEDPKIFLESLQTALEGFSKVYRETLKAFGNLNETALKPGALDRKRLLIQQHFLGKPSPTFC